MMQFFFLFIFVLLSNMNLFAMEAITPPKKEEQRRAERRPDYIYRKMSGDDIETYCLVRKLARIITDRAAEKNLMAHVKGSFMSNFNVCDSTVQSGVAVRMFHGVPRAIFTKWGRLDVLTNAVAKTDQKVYLIAAFLDAVKLQHFTPIGHTSDQIIHITHIDEMPIPIQDSANVLSPAERLSQIRTLTAWYNTPKMPKNENNDTLDVIERSRL